MTPNLREKAQQLAERPYLVEVVLDETTDGEAVYVALNPELEGCMGQGKTIEEAVDDLHEARIDFVYSLLEDELPIPLATTTSSSSSQTLKLSFQHLVGEIKYQGKPKRLYEGTLRT